MSKENHFHRLEIPHSINSISPEQTVNMAFKVTNDKPPPDKIIPKKTRKSEQEEAKLMIGKETLEFSSVGLKDNKCHSIQSPPFLDFLKPSFDFEVPKKPPALKGKVVTRVCGITGSASARRWGGYGFNSRPKPRQS